MTEIGSGTTGDVVTKKNERFLAVCYRTGKNKISCKEVKNLSEVKEILKSKDDPAPENERSSEGEFCNLDRAEDETTFDIESNDPEEIEDDDEEKEE